MDINAFFNSDSCMLAQIYNMNTHFVVATPIVVAIFIFVGYKFWRKYPLLAISTVQGTLLAIFIWIVARLMGF